MFSQLDALGKATLMTDLIAQRQRALGANVANADTPGYIRQDISFGQYLGTLNNPLETKLSMKMGPSPIMTEEEPGPIKLSDEVVQLQENSILYSMATRRLSNIITQMKTVINVGK